MTEISLFDAKTHLSSIISTVEEDQVEYVITKRGKPVAKIVPIADEKKHDIAAVIKDIDNLKREIAKAGISITLEEILSFKDEGRR